MGQTAEKALAYALAHVGGKYSKTYRWRNNPYTRDCSSFMFSAWEAAGVILQDADGDKLTTSTYQVYAKGFELLWPSSYDKIGKLNSKNGKEYSDKSLHETIGLEKGDMLCMGFKKNSPRKNKITHILMYAGDGEYVHARNPELGIRKDPYSYGAEDICAIIRYIEEGDDSNPPVPDPDPTYPVGLPKDTLLKKGMNDSTLVRKMQTYLVKYGFLPSEDEIDGDFGPITEKAVEAVQKLLKIKIDGVWGNMTGEAFQEEVIEGGKRPAPAPTQPPAKPTPQTNAVTTGSVNVRPSASTSKAPIGVLPAGTKVVVEALLGEWAVVEYKGKLAYVHTSYLKITMQNTTKEDPLKIRTGAGTQFKIVGSIPVGAKVQVTSVLSNGWSKVIYGRLSGYSFSGYLKL